MPWEASYVPWFVPEPVGVWLFFFTSYLDASEQVGHLAFGKVPTAESRHRGPLLFDPKTGSKNSADLSTAFAKLPCLTHMKQNREKIEAEDLVKERLPLTKWELTPKEKEDFDRVMRLMFDAASILRYDLELGEDAIGKTLKELADWATN